MIGRLDPKTGDVKVVTYPHPRSNPYGMVFTSEGTPIVCEFGGNRISAIDPKTMAIKEWTLPHEDSRPRRIAITAGDVIWYTDYSRGYLGRLDMKTGDVKEWPSPGGPESRPYGIAAVDGVIWYSESAVRPNTMVRFDPQTGEIPDMGHPRRRRRRAQHVGDARRQHRHRRERRQQDRPRDDRPIVRSQNSEGRRQKSEVRTRMKSDPPLPTALPWTFDTTGVWHTILAGAFALNAVLVLGVLVKIVTQQWLTAVGLGAGEGAGALLAPGPGSRDAAKNPDLNRRYLRSRIQISDSDRTPP